MVEALSTSAPLLERAAETALLEESLASARRGEGRVVLLEGPAGIGKTALLGYVVSLGAEAGVNVTRAAGAWLDREAPFAVVVDLFERLLREYPDDERGAFFTGAAALSAPLFSGQRRARSPAAEYSLRHALYWLAVNLNERGPLLVALDDAHWADRSSLDFVLFLAERLMDLPAVLVIAWRTGEPDTALDLRGELDRLSHVVVVRPKPLTDEAVGTLIQAEQPTATSAFAAACARVTRGNPLLVRELLRTAVSDGIAFGDDAAGPLETVGGAGVQRWVLARLSRLASGSVDVARGVAVLGPDARLGRISALADLAIDAASAAVDGLVDAEVLEPGDPFSFVHPLVRTAVHEGMSATERDRLHLHAAELLEAEDAAPSRVAAHLLQVRPAGRDHVVEVLRAAGAAALADGSPPSAQAYLRRALVEPPPKEDRAAVLAELGRVELMAGAPDAVGHLREGFALAPDAVTRAETALNLGHALYVNGDLAGSAEVLDDARCALEGRVPELDAELFAGWATVARIYPPLRPAARKRFDLLRRSAPPGHTHGERAILAHLASDLVYLARDRPQVIALAHAALAGGELIREEGADGITWLAAAGALAWSGELDASFAVIRQALADAGARGSVVGYANACYTSAWLDYQQGRVAESVANCRAALDARRHGWHHFVPVAYAQLAWALLDRGELAEAAAALAEVEHDQASRATAMHALVLESRARLRLAQRRPAEAVADAEDAGEIITAFDVLNPSILPWRTTAALAHHVLGQRDRGLDLAAEELEIARGFGAPLGIGVALRTQAICLADRHTPELLREAVGCLEGSTAELERCRTIVELGAALRRSGSRTDARHWLRGGLDLAHRLGALGIEERARSELLASGARPRRAAASGVASLTPGEVRVMRLAAEGLTNKEIAQSLFVTLRTVETHLSSVYRKLAVHSRRELPAAYAGGE